MKPTPRDQKVSVVMDKTLLDRLRERQAELARELGTQLSMSQVAAAAMRRGLEGPARN